MLKNIIYLLGMQGVNYLLPLLILPYLVRVLGPESYGSMGLALSIIQYGVLVTDFGFNLHSSARIAKSGNNIKDISRIYSETIYSKLVICVISFICIFSLCLLVKTFSEILGLVLISSIQIIGSVMVPIWLFQGLEKMKVFAILMVLSKLLCLPLIFYFVKSANDLSVAVFIQAFVYFLAGFISIFLVKKMSITFVAVSIKSLIENIKSAFTLFIGTFSISLYTMCTPMILGAVSNTYEVGIFTAADKIRSALLGLFIVLGNVFYPRINKLLTTDKLKAYGLISKIFINQIWICFVVAISFYFLSESIVKFYLGDGYGDVTLLLKIISPMIFLIPSSIILSNYILLPFGYRRYFSTIPIITSLFHLTYVVLLSDYYGALGASISILLTEIFSFMILLFFNVKLGSISLILNAKY